MLIVCVLTIIRSKVSEYCVLSRGRLLSWLVYTCALCFTRRLFWEVAETYNSATCQITIIKTQYPKCFELSPIAQLVDFRYCKKISLSSKFGSCRVTAVSDLGNLEFRIFRRYFFKKWDEGCFASDFFCDYVLRAAYSFSHKEASARAGFGKVASLI